MVWQPDVVIEPSWVVEYDPGSFAAPQPLIEVDVPVETVYQAPPSTGGQPIVVCIIPTETETDDVAPVSDVIGEANFKLVTSATPSLDVAIAPIPADVVFNDIKIVSISFSGSP